MQDHPIAAPNQIAAAVGLQRTNLSTLMRGLEKRGLIERTMSQRDRRGITVRLTQAGRSNYLVVRREWSAALANAVEMTRAAWMGLWTSSTTSRLVSS